MQPGLQIKQLLDNISHLGKTTKLPPNGTGKFSGKLHNILQAVGGKQTHGGKEPEGITFQSLSGEKGRKLIAALRDLFLKNGISPEDIVTNEAALMALKDSLKTAGIDVTGIESLLQSLKADSGNPDVRLSEVFKRLSELEEKEGDEDMLELSSLPYIESILSQFFSDPKQQKAALDGVLQEGQGISLSRLVFNLRKLVQQLPDNGRSVPDQPVQEQIVNLMSQMGLAPGKGTMTLERFVSKLEAMVAEASTSPDKVQAATAAWNRFIDNLSWAKNAKPEAGDLKLSERPSPLPGSKMTVAAAGQAVSDNKFAAITKPFIVGEENPIEAKQGIVSIGEGTSDVRMPAGISTPAAKLPVRTLPVYVLNQVSRQIVRSHQNGNNEIRLQLHPPSLGRLQININGTGDGVRIGIVTEQHATQELLMSHAGGLKSVLLEQGFHLEKIDIQFDQFFDQSFAYARKESNKFNGQRQRGNGFRQNRDIESTEDVQTATKKNESGLLDLVA